MAYNTLEDVLTPFELEVYNTDSSLGRLLLSNALTNKLKEDSNYEVFAPLKYWRYTEHSKTFVNPYIESSDVLISNKGRTSLIKHALEPKVHNFDIGGYPEMIVTIKGRYEQIKTHRAVGCLFVPVNNGNEHIPITKLTINHKNGIKHDNDFSNLEWMTNKQNAEHSRENGLESIWNKKGLDNPATLPMLGTVVVPGRYFGLQFVVLGYRDAVKNGFFSAFRVASGEYNNAKGCVFKFTTKEEAKAHKLITELSKKEITYLNLSNLQKKNYKE